MAAIMMTNMTVTDQTPTVPLPAVDLPVLDYKLLCERDENEIEALLSAASTRGIFYLNLQNSPKAMNVRAHVPDVMKAQREFLTLPKEQKEKFASIIPERGWFAHNNPPSEQILLSREEHLLGTLELPSQLQLVEAQINEIFDWGDATLRNLFQMLCSSVNPSLPTTSVNATAPGYSNITMGHSIAPQGAELVPEHQDSGILSMLYYEDETLEILDLTSGTWRPVKVKPGHATVWVGKSLSRLSGDRFKATLHRVPCPGPGLCITGYLLHPSVRPS